MLSVLYIDRRVINYTCIACLVAYFITCVGFVIPLGNPALFGWTTIQLSVALGLLICGYIVARLILERISDAVETAEAFAHEKERLNRELARDPFTRLFNHISFYERLDQHIVEAQNENLVFSIIIMDIDNFKSINDNFGHDSGDVVLLKFAEIINEELGNEDLAFRFGGEEFIILCRIKLTDAAILAERIRKRLESCTFQQLSHRKVTVSMGICEFDNSFGGRREFFSAADKALYRAKQEGKNRTVATNGYYEGG